MKKIIQELQEIANKERDTSAQWLSETYNERKYSIKTIYYIIEEEYDNSYLMFGVLKYEDKITEKTFLIGYTEIVGKSKYDEPLPDCKFFEVISKEVTVIEYERK